MRPWFLALSIAVLQGDGAAATALRRFDIPAQPLRTAIVSLGEAANVTIGIADPTLGEVRTRAVRGRMDVKTALSAMLATTSATFERVDASTYRVFRRSPADRKRSPAIPAPTPAAAQPDEIVVTASKRSAVASDYPGGVVETDLTGISDGELGHGSEALIARLPIIASTHLGPGRNKLFVRGIGDSSFNGPSQAIIGQYLGDVRLTYSAPDPDLALYDLRKVEVLEGPQGTLYGAGTLGGVIRLEPNAPDLDHASGWLSLGASSTAHGAPGMDGAAIFNIPLVGERLALRVLAYGAIDGGYINDPSRARRDINRTTTSGTRATLRFRPAGDWTIDIGGLLQNIDSRDGQYALRGLPPLTRTSTIAQPFDNDYALASVVIRHQAGATTLTSATSVVFHDVNSSFDASASPATPLRYHQDQRITLITNETRLAHSASNGGSWVLGAETLRSADETFREIGPVGTEGVLAGTSNTVEQLAVFGEATLRIMPRWFVLAGGRISYTRQVGEVLDMPLGGEDSLRHDVAVLPSVGITWKAKTDLAIFARYQEGYRPGGLAVQANGAQRFEADSLATWEAGLRFGSPASRLSGSATISYAHWENIQADLVDPTGLPFTSNIGSGRALGLEIQSRWEPFAAVRIDGAIFVGDSDLSDPAQAFAGAKDAALPNIPRIAGRIGASWRTGIARHPVTFSGALRYVGKSRLGVGPLLDLSQGGYAEASAGARIELHRITVSLDATNLTDTRGNIFALGNPFGVTQGNQITPLRPRTIRLGASVAF